jgi:hypothetical protein
MLLSALSSDVIWIYIQIIYMTNQAPCDNLGQRDRPAPKKPAYFAGFFGVFFAAGLCGAGGVLSILRSTSSGRGIGGGFCAMAGV